MLLVLSLSEIVFLLFSSSLVVDADENDDAENESDDENDPVDGEKLDEPDVAADPVTSPDADVAASADDI